MKVVGSQGGMGFQFSHCKTCMLCDIIMFYIILAFQNLPVIPCKLGTPSQAFRFLTFGMPGRLGLYTAYTLYIPILAIKTYSKDHPPEGLEPLQSLVLEDCQL